MRMQNVIVLKILNNFLYLLMKPKIVSNRLYIIFMLLFATYVSLSTLFYKKLNDHPTCTKNEETNSLCEITLELSKNSLRNSSINPVLIVSNNGSETETPANTKWRFNNFGSLGYGSTLSILDKANSETNFKKENRLHAIVTESNAENQTWHCCVASGTTLVTERELLNCHEECNDFYSIELLKKIIQVENGTTNHLDKVFNYFRARAKLTSPSTIGRLRDVVRQLETLDLRKHRFSSFPENVLVPFTISYSRYAGKKKHLPLLTVNPSGRTGNVMGSYATLLALHRIYNVSVIMHPEMKKILSIDFPRLSLTETLSDSDCYNSSMWHSLENEGGHYSYGSFELAAAGLYGPKQFMLKGTSFEIQLFNLFSKDLVREFTFSFELKRQADEFLHSVRKLSGGDWRNVTFIGFHVRRTDYENHMSKKFNATLPGNSYFERALRYFRSKYANPVFVVASDDVHFVLKSTVIAKQKDVYFSTGRTSSEDLALLSSCNHTIATYGTYSFWIGYLAGGEVVYPEDSNKERRYRTNTRTYSELGLQNFIPLSF